MGIVVAREQRWMLEKKPYGLFSSWATIIQVTRRGQGVVKVKTVLKQSNIDAGEPGHCLRLQHPRLIQMTSRFLERA